MDYSEFYRTLDRLYEEQDQEKVGMFLEDQLAEIDKDGLSAAGADMQLAAAVYNEAASYFRGRGSWENALASLYNNHAAVAAELKETDTALEMYENALASLDRIQGADEERAITLAAMTLLYLEKGEEKKAFECADRAAEMIGDPETHPHGGAIISAKAHCCYRAGDREKAAELFLKGAEITKRFFGENFEYQNCMENYRKAADS